MIAAFFAALWLVASAADSSAAAAPRDSASIAVPAAPDSIHPALVLPEVHVDRARPVMNARRRLPSGFVSDLTGGATHHALETVPELLTRAAAIRIQQYGGLGAFATVSIRGAPANETAFYLDGAPLTSAAASLIDVSSLPVTAIDRIEVYRGLAPLELGPVTPGGAINVVTLPAAAPMQGSFTRGSYETWEGRATGGGRLGAWSATGHAGWQGTRGDFTYLDDNGTPFNRADDALAHRQNAGFDGRTLLGAVRGPLGGDVSLTVRGSVFHRAQGVPGLGAVPALHTHLATDRGIAQLGLERPGTRLIPGARLDVERSRDRARFQDLAHELGSRAFDTNDRSSSDRVTGGLTSPRLPGGVTLATSAAWRGEHADLHDAALHRPDPPESHRTTHSATADVRVEPWRDVVLLEAGRRWDAERDALHGLSPLGTPITSNARRTLVSPQLRGRVRTPLGLELRANWGRAARAPDFLELFGNAGSVVGNPTLVPERAETWDAGGAWDSPAWHGARGHVEWAHYETHAHDLVAYVQNSASSVKAQNIARARIRGEELSAAATLPFGIDVTGWMTWQSTIDLGDVPAWHGRRLPLRPERHGFVALGWHLGPLEPRADAEWIGADFLDRANRMRAPGRTLLGASLACRVRPGITLTVEAKNLGDTRASDVAGFPLPGRSAFASIRIGPAGPDPPGPRRGPDR